MKKPLALLILDGYGENKNHYGNAIYSAHPENLNKLFSENPSTLIDASGLAVGLPDGQMGNSEVGHTNIGAGRVVYQDLVRISKSIEDGDFFENEVLLGAIKNAKENDGALHLMGLLSDGGVHSHYNHLFGLLKLAKKEGLEKVYIHAFMDGRDVSPTSGLGFVKDTVEQCCEIGVGRIATICGRYYSMDRDNAWDRVVKAYNALVLGEGNYNEDPVATMKNSYEEKVTDEFIIPTVCDKDGMIKENDSVIFFNFRPDRARQITRSFVDKDFKGFDCKKMNLYFVCMTEYDATMPNVKVAFSPKNITMPFGEFISNKGLTQLRIAETQKYAHVTFFFNGGEEKTFKGEERVLVKSPDVATFDLKPEMSAYEVCDAVCNEIDKDKYDVIILNYANCDMVGHTGIVEAAEKAVKAVDECTKKTVDKILSKGGVAIITADHGNAEKMLEENGEPFTAHTINKVPLAIVGLDKEITLKNDGKLADIAPTMLEILGLEKPDEMDGESLIVK